MKKDVYCCQALPDHPAAISPFSKLIILGYYDGATSGVLRCEHCSKVYRFEMIDWDNNQKVRIYSLSLLPPGSFEALVAVLEEFGQQPYWPDWIVIWKFTSAVEEEIADHKVQQILEQAKAVELILASENLHKAILMTRKVTKEELKGMLDKSFLEDSNSIPDWFAWEDACSIPDWFTFVGL